MEEENKEDLKTGDDTPPDNGQAGDKDEHNLDELPDWARNRLSKAEEERENYKQGLLAAKKKKEEAGEWDEPTQKLKGEILTEAERIAESKVNEIIGKRTVDITLNDFRANNPSITDEQFVEIKSNYDVVKDVDKAYLLYKHDHGESTFDKGKKAGVIEGRMADLAAVGAIGSKVNQSPVLTQEEERAERLAKKMPIGYKFTE